MNTRGRRIWLVLHIFMSRVTCIALSIQACIYLHSFYIKVEIFVAAWLAKLTPRWAHGLRAQRGIRRTIFVCNRQFAKVDKGSNLRWWQKLIWIISMSIATAILGAIRVKMEGWGYTTVIIQNNPLVKEFYSENSRVLLQGQENNFLFYLAHHWLLRSDQRSAVT